MEVGITSSWVVRSRYHQTPTNRIAFSVNRLRCTQPQGKSMPESEERRLFARQLKKHKICRWRCGAPYIFPERIDPLVSEIGHNLYLLVRDRGQKFNVLACFIRDAPLARAFNRARNGEQGKPVPILQYSNSLVEGLPMKLCEPVGLIVCGTDNTSEHVRLALHLRRLRIHTVSVLALVGRSYGSMMGPPGNYSVHAALTPRDFE